MSTGDSVVGLIGRLSTTMLVSEVDRCVVCCSPACLWMEKLDALQSRYIEYRDLVRISLCQPSLGCFRNCDRRRQTVGLVRLKTKQDR
jgi:hypothetical protein